MSDRIERVVVVGRHAALWLSAAAIARALGPAGVQVDAVEVADADACALPLAYTSLPALEALHNKIGIKESSLLATGAAFSLGHNFVDSEGSVPSFFHAWSAYGAPIDGTAFLPQWLKARRYGLPAELQDFCLAAVAAKNGRMIVPDDETDAFGRLDYGYHLPAEGYVSLLRSVGSRVGVRLHQTADVGVVHGEDGGIEAVLLDGGRRLEGDLFVDAGGAEARLFAHASADALESWRGTFPADRILTARGPVLGAIPAYADQRAWEGGWTRLQPDRAGTSVVQAFSASITDDEAALAAAEGAAGFGLVDAAFSQSAPGRRKVAWERNCVAIGGAAATFDPIHGVDLHAVQLGIVHLLALLPARIADLAAPRSEYNRRIRSLFERIRDFQAATYLLAPWQGSFWDGARRSPPSIELAHLVATFQARAEIPPMEDETFQHDSWRAMLVGLGVVPETWSPAIDRVPPDRMKAEFRRMLGFIAEKVRQQPTHGAYIAASDRSEAA